MESKTLVIKVSDVFNVGRGVMTLVRNDMNYHGLPSKNIYSSTIVRRKNLNAKELDA